MEARTTSILAALCILAASVHVVPAAVPNEALRELEAKFPYYFTGTNKLGQPVYLAEWSKWDFRSAFEEGTSIELFDEFCTKLYSTMIQHGRSSGNGSILVEDVKGFRSSQVDSPTVQQFLLNQTFKFDKMNEGEGIKQGYVVNANQAYLDMYKLIDDNLKTNNEVFKIHAENVNEWPQDLLSYLNLDSKTRTESSGLSPLQVLLNEEFSNEFRTKFPYYLSGYAADGSPIFIMPLGKYDYKSVIEKGPDASEQLSRLMSQMLLRLHTTSVKAPGGRGAILIVDAKGLTAEQIETPAVRKHILSDFTMMNKINSEPGLHKIYVINAPPTVWGKFHEDLEPLINSRKKTQVFYEDEEFRLVLREEVKTPIPQEYGGTSDYIPLVSYGTCSFDQTVQMNSL